MMLSNVRLSVAYIGPKSRTQRPRKTKIGTEVAHVTCDSDTTFNVKRSNVKVTGAGAYCGGLPHSLFCMHSCTCAEKAIRSVHSQYFTFPLCFNTVSLAIGRESQHLACNKVRFWFVGGDYLTGALHLL